jgi:hypothetical protein
MLVREELLVRQAKVGEHRAFSSTAHAMDAADHEHWHQHDRGHQNEDRREHGLI